MPLAFLKAFRAFRPSPQVRTIVWAIENIVNDQGRPYDHAAFPHLGAPGGPMDAFDDARTRQIALQWATRLGKTFFGQVCLTKTADTDPAPMMFASSVEKLAKEGVQRLYASCHQRARLNDLLLRNEREQKQDLVEFRGCKVYVAWARSVSTLADKNIKVGHGGEWDKWEHQSTSKEAHPHKLYDDRFKDYQSVRKVIKEGSPTVKDRSPIEALRLSGTNCKYNVPCPHCKKYQALEFGKDTPHGIKWDRDESGKHHPEIAYRTARYVCRHCGGECRDHHRAWMMRRGVWCPEGCEVDHAKALEVAEKAIANPGGHEWNGWRNASWIIGTPARDGSDASYHLSSLYALSLGWGDIAKEFVISKRKPQELRNFINQWLGETWELHPSKSTPEKVAERIGSDRPQLIVPLGATFLTVSADRQAAEGGFVVYVVMAHGDLDQDWLIDYGTKPSLHELYKDVFRQEYEHEDGGQPLIPMLCVVDSGWDTKKTYDFANTHQGIIPCKGSSESFGVLPYRIVQLKTSKTGLSGQTLLQVNTDYWETDLQGRLDDRLAEEPGSLTLCRTARHDFEFIGQLLNGVLTDKLDTRGNAKLQWIKKEDSHPNDYRDAVRYGLCLRRAIIDENGGQLPPRYPIDTRSSEPPESRRRLESRRFSRRRR